MISFAETAIPEESVTTKGNLLSLRYRKDGTPEVSRRSSQATLLILQHIDDLPVLNHLLTETDDTVIVHHARFAGSDTADIRQGIDRLKSTSRNFHYLETAFDGRGIGLVIPDASVLTLEAAQVAKSFIVQTGNPVDRIAYGSAIPPYTGGGDTAGIRDMLESLASAAMSPLGVPRLTWIQLQTPRS